MSRKQNSMIGKQVLLEVILENRKEVQRYEVAPRDISLSDFDRQVLVGVRRAGKSYLLFGHIQKLISKGHNPDEIVYVNFEDERLAGMTLADLNSILEVNGSITSNRPILFLDEIQNVDGWEKFARRLADQKYKVFITGSNAKMLSADVASTLGGRYITREVFPLSFKEYLEINGIDSSDKFYDATTEQRSVLIKRFEEYYNFGGFPECAGMASKRDYLMSLYQKIFLGDIAARHKVENIFALRVLFKKLAESIKQPLSFTRATNIIASTGTKIGKNTVINYIEYAKNAWLLFAIPNIADNLTDRVSNPKYYFIDNGIISLLALDVRTSLLENLVAMALLRKYGSRDAVYHYNHEIEVDFYIPDQEMAIQVCYSLDQNAYDREIKGLLKMEERLPIKQRLIVTFDEEREIEKDGKIIKVISARQLERCLPFSPTEPPS